MSRTPWMARSDKRHQISKDAAPRFADSAPGPRGSPVRIAVIDTGVNPWHSHVGGAVDGFRIYAHPSGEIREDGDFRDPLGHGTAVAGVLREGLPEAEFLAVRVFDHGLRTYPSLVARAVLRAAAEGCRVLNLSLAVPAGAGSDLLAEACASALEAGCLLVAAADPEQKDCLPAALPGVVRAVADDNLAAGEVRADGPLRFAALGRPRDLRVLPQWGNLRGHSFACPRVVVHLTSLGSRAIG